MTNLGVYWIGLQRLPALANDTNWQALKQFLRNYEWTGNVPVEVFPFPNSPHLKYSEAKSQPQDDIIIGTQLLDTDTLTVAAFRQKMADAFGVNVSNITNATVYRTQELDGYNARITTFAYLGTDYFELWVFGWVNGQGWPSQEENYEAMRTYHDANIVTFWGVQE